MHALIHLIIRKLHDCSSSLVITNDIFEYIATEQIIWVSGRSDLKGVAVFWAVLLPPSGSRIAVGS